MFVKPRFGFGDVISNGKSIGKVTGLSADASPEGSCYVIEWFKQEGPLIKHKKTIQHTAYTDIHYNRLKNGRLLFGPK